MSNLANHHTTGDNIEVHICMGTGGVAAGGKKVYSAFEKAISQCSADAVIKRRNCKVKQTGCRGLCAMDVLVDIIVPGEEVVTYQEINTEAVPAIVEEHILGGNPVKKHLAKDDYHKFYDKQQRTVLSNCGRVDPENIEDYILMGGYTAMKKALTETTPEEVIEEIKISGLRGRGGAGFPTGLKWSFCRAAKNTPKYVIVNADEGDPGAFMDRSVMEGDPHAVLEGLIIGAYAIGSEEGFIYCRAEYPLAVKRFNIAIEQAREKGFLGRNLLGTDFSFDCTIREGAGAFVCGEETALMGSIEGHRGMPTPRPPFPAQQGLWNQPSNINNVETWANVPLIINKGGNWHNEIGTRLSKGTKVFALTGKIKHTGLIEVPMGITLKEIVYDICGGIPGRNRVFKAAQMGGPSGGCIPASLIDTHIDYDSLIEVGAMMGSGGIVVMDQTSCMVDMAKYFLTFTQNESCGKCVPCRIGTHTMLQILTRITEGNGKEGDVELLEDVAKDIRGSSLCGLGQTAPNPILSTIRHFREEYDIHIREKRCPAAACKPLVNFRVVEDKCKRCGLCKKACPANAVQWERKELAAIDLEKCIKCMSCIDVCPFLAID